jgi:hypothetical protein
MMKSDRNISVAYGILLVAGIIFGIFSSVPALEEPDYLVKLSSIKIQVLIAVCSQCAMAIVYTLIAVIAYPIIKPYNQDAARGYFGFRIIGASFLYVGIATLLSLLFVSERYIAAGHAESLYYQAVGELIRINRDWLNHVGMILPWSLGGLILYYAFFRMDIIPGWLSMWGFIGSVLTLVATFLILFQIIKIVTPIYFILNAPAALFEITLSIYLFVKGFRHGDAKPVVI